MVFFQHLHPAAFKGSVEAQNKHTDFISELKKMPVSVLRLLLSSQCKRNLRVHSHSVSYVESVSDVENILVVTVLTCTSWLIW